MMRMLAQAWTGIWIGLAAIRCAGQTVYEPYVFTTISGDGYIGTNDGPAVVAHYYGPSSIALDNAGNLYVGDSWNGTIRKLTSEGTVMTLAGKAGTNGGIDGAGSGARATYV